jgi:hypothetical protein
MKLADVDWLSSFDEHLGPYFGTFRGGELTSFRIDFSGDNAVRGLECMHILIRGMLVCPLHELYPDRQGAVGSFQHEIPIVVEPQPNHANKFRCETGKPPVS